MRGETHQGKRKGVSNVVRGQIMRGEDGVQCVTRAGEGGEVDARCRGAGGGVEEGGAALVTRWYSF